MLIKKNTITSGTWLNYSWLHSLSPPDYEQEPQLNEIDLLGPQPIRLRFYVNIYIR